MKDVNVISLNTGKGMFVQSGTNKFDTITRETGNGAVF